MNRTLKHYVKLLLRKPDPFWPLYTFEQSFHPAIWRDRAALLAWAEECAAEYATRESSDRYLRSTNPLVRQGYLLKQKSEQYFRNLLEHAGNGLRILIHVPDEQRSPAGYSLFKNFAEAFTFIGIPTTTFSWNDPISECLSSFKPTVLLSSDHATWLEKIDWDAVDAYRSHSQLHIGLTAGLEEYGNTPLLDRLDWGKKHDISFYYSYRDPEYVQNRKEYRPFFDQGYNILSLPFGANILHYYPVPDIDPDLDFAFLASVNGLKATRYIPFLKHITHTHTGIFDGPGWLHVSDFSFNRDRDRYLYARSKIGLNISLQEQIDWASEVNERTFMLAACGIPQVTDNAKLLPKLFSPNALFVGDTPETYRNHMETILRHPEIGRDRALTAQREVFDRHTTFHRAEAFARALLELDCMK